MARKTDGEKIDELVKVTTALEEGLKVARAQLDAIYDTQSKAAEIVADLRRQYETDTALLKREIDDLRKWKDDQKKQQEEYRRRLWAFGPNLLAALVSGIVAFVVAYFMAHR